MKLINLSKSVKKGAAVLLTICLITVVPTFGDYELSWSTIDGGGGQSTGGSYVLTATIGEPEAGASSGGDYELLGGFWPGEPLCTVDFEHFVRFAEYWLATGPGLPADLYEDDIVNWLDMGVFVDEWLYWCPYNWPLK